MARTLVTDIVTKEGTEVELYGWVDSRRDHGKIIFIDIRDRSGIAQVVFTPAIAHAETLRSEYVIKLTGMVKKRPASMVNEKIVTGEYEVEATGLEILNVAEALPISVGTDGKEINEEMRLKYRYLDLRRERMQKIIELRSRYFAELRHALDKERFVEIETPMLTKATKEGARDFIVPSRLQHGKFYALPQSPQQYKQLLMVAGVERYFQFARCIRDEDLRADRGFEHTQLDLEMSFVDQQQVMNTVEHIVKGAITAVGGKLQSDPFPVFTYDEAMQKYGADKFDMRTEEEKAHNILAFAWVTHFPFFKKVDKGDIAEVRDGKSGWTFTHNPFSQPFEEDIEKHLAGKDVGSIRTCQYDLVCNGYEIGGGSIRAHKPEVLRATLRIMGYTDEQIEESVGHMLEAFSYGAPPHGGIALGLDRHIMILAGEESLREVIPFPMSSGGQTSVMDAPSEVSEEQLKELGIQVVKEKK